MKHILSVPVTMHIPFFLFDENHRERISCKQTR